MGIAQSTSLYQLAKVPSSSIQICGAEKALFRALKSKKETPKYGLIYESSLVRQSNPKNKGKISRSIAAKCSLVSRLDALSETPCKTFGSKNRVKIVSRLRSLETA